VGKGGGVNSTKNQRNHIAGMFKFTVISYFASPQAMGLTQLKQKNKINRNIATDL